MIILFGCCWGVLFAVGFGVGVCSRYFELFGVYCWKLCFCWVFVDVCLLEFLVAGVLI